MNQSLDREILAQLARYLAGEQSIAAFHRWFLPASWNVHRSGNPAAERLVGDVGLILAEHDAGDRTEDEVREQLRPLIAADPARSA